MRNSSPSVFMHHLGLISLCLACASTFFAVASSAQSSKPLVDKIEVRDTIQPISAGRLERAITHANRDPAAPLLIELGTPGGLLDSTRQMVGAMLASKVPIIVYVG